MDDRELIGLFFEREEAAITELEKKYGRFITSIAGNILYDREDVEETVNDVLYRIWQRIPPERPDNLPGFIGKITREKAIDLYRKNTSGRRSGKGYVLCLDDLDNVIAKAGDPAEELTARELSEILNRWLRGQKPDARNIFVLRYYFGDSVKAIAKAGGFTEAKVLSTIFRLKKSLRAYLRKEEYLE